MTVQELNRDIKRLNKYIKGIQQAAEMMNDNTAFFRDIEGYAKPEFIRLFHASDDFSQINKESVLILLRLNLCHRFIPLHTFGLKVNI
jgi:hypothetical protein